MLHFWAQGLTFSELGLLGLLRESLDSRGSLDAWVSLDSRGPRPCQPRLPGVSCRPGVSWSNGKKHGPEGLTLQSPIGFGLNRPSQTPLNEKAPDFNPLSTNAPDLCYQGLWVGKGTVRLGLKTHKSRAFVLKGLKVRSVCA